MGLKTTADLLREARDLIADPKRWTQGALARDRRGNPCPARSPQAVCWCASGAAIKADENGGSSAFWALIGAAEKRRVFVPPVNDGEVAFDGLTPHGAVLRLFDEAIESAERRPC